MRNIPYNCPGHHRPDGGAKTLHDTAGQQQVEVIGEGTNGTGQNETNQPGHQGVTPAKMVGGNTRRDLPECKPCQVQADNQLGTVGIDLQIVADQ